MKVIDDNPKTALDTTAQVELTLREVMYLSSLLASSDIEDHFEADHIGFDTTNEMTDFDYAFHSEVLKLRITMEGKL